MPPTSNIERVLLYPRSGYSNRLQAMASSAILAKRLGAEFRICWEIENVVPEGPEFTFDPDFCAEVMVTPGQCMDNWSLAREELPRYLNVLQDRRLIVLAGHDRGEQEFMGALARAIETAPISSTIVIVAGGQFFLYSDASTYPNWRADFRTARHDYYTSVPFHPKIESEAANAIASREPFLGLHLRYTDRAHQAPFDGQIRRAMLSAATSSGLTHVFVAADSRATREKWSMVAEDIGLHAWSYDQASWDRTASGSGLAALTDWRILTRADRLIYFAESTFAEEAAVASTGYTESIALGPSAVRSTLLRAQGLAQTAVSYPRRHGWLRHSSTD